jgi:hypothetical protein
MARQKQAARSIDGGLGRPRHPALDDERAQDRMVDSETTRLVKRRSEKHGGRQLCRQKRRTVLTYIRRQATHFAPLHYEALQMGFKSRAAVFSCPPFCGALYRCCGAS